MNEAENNTGVLDTVLDWSTDKPDWWRDGLRRIVAGGLPDDEAVEELISLARKSHGDNSVTLNAKPLTTDNLPCDPGAGDSIRLYSLRDVAGVNQLAPNQEIAFETGGLTVIYGKNGAGKSGYARVLKKACRARFPGEIMPDMLGGAPAVPPTAKLVFERAQGTPEEINWTDAEAPDPLLSAITVFDKDCGAEHIRRNNEVWFRPFGLDIPDDLARICITAKAKLASRKDHLEQLRDPVFSNPTWSHHSTIGSVLESLTSETDLSLVDFDTPLSPNEEAELAQLVKDLSQNPTAIADEQRRDAQVLRQAIATLRNIHDALSEDAVTTMIAKKAQATAKRQAADLAAEAAFSDLELDGVGQPTWKALWDSARAYSDSLTKHPRSFPPTEGETCVLCHQPIDAHTAARLDGFETFIKQETEDQAISAERVHQTSVKSLRELRIEIGQATAARRILSTRNAGLARKVLKFMAAARLRRFQLLNVLDHGSEREICELPSLPDVEIEAEAKAIFDYAEKLSADASSEERQVLVTRLAELKDRKNGANLKTIAETEIARLEELRIVDACLKETNTRTIKTLGNLIADELVTPKMQDRFQLEIIRLAGSRIRVKMERTGGQTGSPQYAVKFFANADAKVHQVLSEGEQTCVALAAYLTELATATHNSALVFDDPVTSLDHRWRRRVAERLAEEAQKRQVIVFTHDLVFLNDLDTRASQLKVPTTFATVERSGDRVGIVKEGLPWRAGKLGQRIDTLEKEVHSAKKLYENHDEEAYAREVRAIYGRLRSTWERGIETEVFANVILRQREYVDTKNLRAVTVLDHDDVDAFEVGFKKCCDFTEAHDSSMGLDQEVPTPDELLTDIQALKNWADSIREKRKQVAH